MRPSKDDSGVPKLNTLKERALINQGSALLIFLILPASRGDVADDRGCSKAENTRTEVLVGVRTGVMLQ